ncbi:MAG TPA: hypothetical protein VG453_08245 [Nitrospira sp.]|nr:hypothetical protein [Nitrospira sp.]
MIGAECVILAEGQLVKFAFSVVRLAVRCSREWILRMRAALGKAIARIGCAHELHCANREKEKKNAVDDGTGHDALSSWKSRHRTMTGT